MAPKPYRPSQETLDAQKRAEERAVAQEQTQLAEASARMRTMRTGGLRLLFSQQRLGTNAQQSLGTTLGVKQ